ncbi:hypothetical protein NGB36_17605 [Streptomyces sp. RB6PN25]|uniref:Uncharacterized protein n=1 Tax=Streptomyces humicola TaxID=2953240 RepID=A0ABT1PXF2_9ACTN|nr:hypothetical protein [Streptomyces humicola]MCQ4082366.1 hypothetical protein [Streptomyces humicola]
MKLSFLEPLYAAPGPYACVYVDTSRDIDDPDKAIEVRWRHMGEDLIAQGADEATVAALAAAVGDDCEVSGRHGQAIFASHGRVVLEEELPQPPVRDSARFAVLPDAMPLAVQHAPDIPYAAVVVHRADQRGAGGEDPELEVDFQAGRWPVSSVAPGPCHHRRSLAEDWPHGADEVAGELQCLVDRSGAEVIVLCGDAWARGVLAHHLPRRLSSRVVAVAGDGHGGGEGRALLEDGLNDWLHGAMSVRDQARVETFVAQRARRERAVEGMPAVVATLQRGQACTLLLNTPVRFPCPLWAGPEPTHIALSAADLDSFGVREFQTVPAGTALIRALVGTAAELVALPRTGLRLEDGMGALLRYTDVRGPQQ